MPLDDLLQQEAASPFSEEDHIAHTTKFAERAFGRPVEDLGRVEWRDDRAVLVFDYNGQQHTLSWARQPNGAIWWYVNDDPKPLILGQSERAAQVLADRLGQGGTPRPAARRQRGG